jgi:hypothetical protein
MKKANIKPITFTEAKPWCFLIVPSDDKNSKKNYAIKIVKNQAHLYNSLARERERDNP